MKTIHVILYHNIAITETPFEAGLNVTTHPNILDKQIEWLSRRFSFVSLQDVIVNSFPSNSVLITFDDYYRSVFDVARDILHPRGIPSVFFINSNLLGPTNISLDSVLAWCASKHGLDALRRAIGTSAEAAPSLGALVANVVSKQGSKARLQLKDDLIAHFDLSAEEMASRSPAISEKEVAALPRYGVEIGNHTSSHVHCRALSARERTTEIVESKKRLEMISGQRVRSFAVPYGHEQDLSLPILEALRESGHEAIFLVHGRSNLFRPENDIWYRVSLKDTSPAYLGIKVRMIPIARTASKLLSNRFK